MKKFIAFLLAAVAALFVFSCSQEDVNIPTANLLFNEKVEADYESVTLTCTVDGNFTAERLSVEYSTDQSLSGAKVKALDKQGDTFRATISGLKAQTTYYYRYTVSNKLNSYTDKVIRQFYTNHTDVEKVSLDRKEYTFHTIGSSLTLRADIYPPDASDQSTTWTSSDKSVATVDQNGKVTAIGNGSATITVKTNDQGKTAVCSIFVAQYVTGIELNKTTFSLCNGDSEILKATASPSNAYDKTVSWTSSNNSVAKVDANGRVTAVSLGTATITATANDGSGEYASCTVTVSNCPSGAVDLGLSVYWASCNLSDNGFANSPEESGDYYAWGETQPKSSYTWGTYELCNGSSSRLIKYNVLSSFGSVDNKTTLDASDDAAHIKLGKKWRIPTSADWEELSKKCTCIKTTKNGVPGYEVKALNGNSIFFPAAGLMDGTSKKLYGDTGYYWSSNLYTGKPHCARTLTVEYGLGSIAYSGERNLGQSIRPVSD